MIPRGETLDLFTRRRRTFLDFLEEDENPDPDGLRWMQREAFDANLRAWRQHRSVLNVLATGLGKTQLFCAQAKRWTDGDVLILAHRDELVLQARDRLESMIDGLVEIEQGDYRASHRAHFVVGSTDSVKRMDRLERMGHDRFSLVIVDEAHHYVAGTYKKILEWFRSAKVLGVTATPDRADEIALGQVFDDVPYCMDIEDGIDAGYLVPVKVRQVDVKEINLEKVHTTADGGLNESELDEAMLEAVAGIVTETLRIEPDRQGIAFFPGRRSAELAMQKFNAVRPGSACYIDGETERNDRRRIVADFKAGRYKYLCNCKVATEGFDAPEASLIIQGAPTTSRMEYAQKVGRGTRVLPGVVDHIFDKGASPIRRAAVARSAKPNCMVLDFVGNSGKHCLVTPEDVLGGNYTEAEVEYAKKKRPSGGGDALENLKEARRELERLARSAKVASVKSEVREVDPFRVFLIPMTEEAKYQRFGKAPATEGQLGALRSWGVKDDDLAGLTKRAASRLLDEFIERKNSGLCSYNQLKLLRQFGVTNRNIPYERASAVISYIKAKGYGRRGKIDPMEVDAILNYRPRAPGED